MLCLLAWGDLKCFHCLACGVVNWAISFLSPQESMQKRFVWIEIEKSGWTLYVSTYYLPSSFFPGVLDFCCSQWVPTKFLLCSHQVPNGFPPSPYCVPIKFPMGSQRNPQVFHVFLNMFLIAPHLITHALLNIALLEPL